MSTHTRPPSNPRFAVPRAAYLHVPFCRHRCGYCNFTLVAGRDDLIDRYVQAIAREWSGWENPHELDTLYFGGGTPTHLPNEPLQRLLAVVHRAFRLAPHAEFTVEANPLDVDPDKLQLLRRAGVNRISLGVQSFDDRWLQLLERDHRGEQAAESVAKCLAIFPAVSLDLIFGLPGQTLDDWRRDLDRAIACGTQHLSLYGLTFERGTQFWSRQQRGALAACPEELEREMYVEALERLEGAGFEHYEVSNFGRPGFRSRHNESYWMGRTYFAAGPGAARHLDGVREMNHRSTTTYLNRVLAGQSPVAESERLSDDDAARERFVFGLRRLEGVEVAPFEAETGRRIDDLFHDPLARFEHAGLIKRDAGRIRLTRDGLLVSDALWPEFLG